MFSTVVAVVAILTFVLPGFVIADLAEAKRATRRRGAFPAVALVWADGGYAGNLVEWAKAAARIVLEIVKKPEGQRGFEVLPRRWVVERTLSWITGLTATTNASRPPPRRWSNGR